MSLTGKVVFASGRAVDFDIWSFDFEEAGLEQLTAGNNCNDFPRWSPDGQKIAYISTQDDLIPSLWVMGADGSNKRQLTKGTYCQFPSWSPDGKRILFTANALDPNEIEVCAIAESGGPVERLFARSGMEGEPSWSPKGDAVIFSAPASEATAGVESRNTDIWEYKLQLQSFRRITSHPSKDYSPAYSPDGARIAFVSHRNSASEGEYQVALREIAALVKRGDMTAIDNAIRKVRTLESDGDVFVMQHDGTGLVQLTKDRQADSSVCWSPCGNYLMYTTSSMREGNAERLRIIDARTGAAQSFSYDRAPLEAEIGASSALNATFLQRILPNFIERRLTDRSFWGEERHPHWISA